MIVLLSCFINLYGNTINNFSTGELEQKDSVLISYDDLRIVNCKLIELNYERETNTILRKIIWNDSLVIDTLTIDNTKLNSEIKILNKLNKKYKKQRNIGFSFGIITTITTILMLIK